MKRETYEQFVEKFKPKKTTDDCYTPQSVYDAVVNYVGSIVDLTGKDIVRPFYPGGDYENYDYPENCIVIDNPPFSIISQICKFYEDRGVDFFLFAPGMTILNICPKSHNICRIVTDVEIIYENGAVVPTGFVTNIIEDCVVMSAPELKRALIDVQKQKQNKKHLPRYDYPDEVVTIGKLKKIAKTGFKIRRGEAVGISHLDCQKKAKKAIFGQGYLVSELKAAELKAAELKAAELKITEEKIRWTLSDREREIVKNLKTR